jgi:methyl-accepting chemotaxis protein
MSATFPKSAIPTSSVRPESLPAFTEFFRHHGAWAPGVRLFRRINFTTKAVLISLAFLLPMLFLVYQYLDVKTEVIRVAKAERDGVEYTKEIVPLLQYAQLNRLAATSAASGAAVAGAADYVAGYEAQQQRLAAVEKKLGAQLETGNAYNAYLAAAAAARAATGTPDEVFAKHVVSVDAILTLLDRAVDGSGLSLDPAIESYYLMDASLVRAPILIEAMATMRGTGYAALKAGELSPGQSARINQNFPMASYHQKGLEFGLGKVLKERPGLRTELDYEKSAKAAQEYLAEIERVFLSGAIAASPPQSFVDIANRAITGQYDVNKRMLALLDKLLEERITTTEYSRNVALLALGFSVLLALYLFRSFHFVTHGGLREVQRHLEAMTDGDLTTSPKPWGSDEAARLMFSLSDMQQSLRTIVSQVRGSSDSIVQASTEIASASADLSSRTEQTAANLEESAASVEQVSSTVKNTADNAQQAASLAAANTGVAERGGVVIAKVVSTMQEINTSSTKIREIIGTIDGIAFQTNILALNAAVEAARAGEQGRGFAVVASEVRTLAQRSADAAKEIKSLISTSVEQVEQGAVVVKGAGDTMSEIVTSAKRMSSLLSEISTASNEQASGISQVSSSVQELDRMTQQNAALVEETAAAAASLNQQAIALGDEVSRFRLP